MKSPRIFIVVLLCLTIAIIPCIVAGAVVNPIHVSTEAGGDIDSGAGSQWDGVYENTYGAMTWGGTDWIVNNTYSHMYLTFLTTGLRLIAHDILATFEGPGDGATINGYAVTRNTYNYTIPSATVAGRTYAYEAVEYTIVQPDGKKVILRSRGSGNGTSNAYLNIYIEDPDSGGTSAFRGDPVWFNYAGLTPEQAVLQTDGTENASGNFPTCNDPKAYYQRSAAAQRRGYFRL